MNQSPKSPVQQKAASKPAPPSKTFVEQLDECLRKKSIVEVMFKSDFEITGVISIIGTDFLGLTSMRERTIETTSKGQDGKVEKQKVIQVFELETFVKFKEIQAVSRVLKKTVK